MSCTDPREGLGSLLTSPPYRSHPGVTLPTLREFPWTSTAWSGSCSGNGKWRDATCGLYWYCTASDAVMRFLDSLDPMMARSAEIRPQLGNWSLEQPADEPTSTVALAVTVILAGFAGGEGCLDFYHASPFAVHRVTEGATQIGLEPVVRVTLPTAALFALLDELRRIAPGLKLFKGGEAK